ncbi:MAG: mannitol dehydrogenase family protein [Burkholderiaceae bacterium]
MAPILQFGTSRFLQAHVDLFVSQAMERGAALGGITVVQTTNSSESAARVAAFNTGDGYAVRVRGRLNGTTIDTTLTCHAVHGALQADADWARVRALAAGEVQVIVSNTGDRGYAPDDRDSPASLVDGADAPHGFPAKLVVLLHDRWRCGSVAPLSIYPCELISRNGDTLRDLVVALATGWDLPAPFITYLRSHCVWANSLVDRIVSEPLQPAGAVAEPYALWAVERQAGLVLPCTHEAIVLTDDLPSFERRKLFLLNLGHSVLAERWLLDRRRPDETVLEAMNDASMRETLELVWADEVLPVFNALGQGNEALAYLVELRERLLNPFLGHRLSDIAKDHALKKQRRFAPVLALAGELGLSLEQPWLRAAVVGASGAARLAPVPKSASP